MTPPFDRNEELVNAIYDAMVKSQPTADRISCILNDMSEAHDVIYDVNGTGVEAGAALTKKRLLRVELRAALVRLFKETLQP